MRSPSLCMVAIVILGVILASLPSVEPQELYVEWNASAPSGWEVPPRVKDLDLDRKDEILAMSSGDPPMLFCFSYEGNVNWQALLQEGHPVGLSIGDLNGDGLLEVVCACSDRIASGLFAFDSEGEQMWMLELEGRCTAPPMAYDLDWDGSDEVLVVDEGRGLHCIDGASGELLWTVRKRMPNSNHIVVADLGRAGKLDVLWFQNKTASIWVIDPTIGEVSRTLNGTTERSYFGWPAIGDMDADGSLDLVVCTAQEVLCLDTSTFSLDWVSETESMYASAMGDVDGDGLLELLVPGNGVITCLESDGSQKYQVDIEDAGWLGSVCIADIDGDGGQEAVVPVHGTQMLHAIDAETGLVETSYGSELGGIFDGQSATALADGDWDRVVEIYVGTTGEGSSPFLSLSSQEGSAHHSLEWPQFFHDWRGSGNYETTIVTVVELPLLLFVPLLPLLSRRFRRDRRGCRP